MNKKIAINYYNKKVIFLIIDRWKGWLYPSTPLVFKYRGHLDECTIRLMYASFLTAITFRKFGSAWGLISGIRVEIRNSNPQVCHGGNCWQIKRLTTFINSSYVRMSWAFGWVWGLILILLYYWGGIFGNYLML